MIKGHERVYEYELHHLVSVLKIHEKDVNENIQEKNKSKPLVLVSKSRKSQSISSSDFD